MHGLGAALMQEDKMVSFALKTLNDRTSRHSKIEREIIAIVFGFQRFHTFLFA